MYCVTYLQAVEPSELTARDGIEVEIEDELDSMGFNRVAVYAPTPGALVSYVLENWGEDDPGWFASHVLQRVHEVPDLRLTVDDLSFAGDNLELLAGLDEGENTDYDRLRRVGRALVALSEVPRIGALIDDALFFTGERKEGSS